jgi:hypothetical protein
MGLNRKGKARLAAFDVCSVGMSQLLHHRTWYITYNCLEITFNVLLISNP